MDSTSLGIEFMGKSLGIMEKLTELASIVPELLAVNLRYMMTARHDELGWTEEQREEESMALAVKLIQTDPAMETPFLEMIAALMWGFTGTRPENHAAYWQWVPAFLTEQPHAPQHRAEFLDGLIGKFREAGFAKEDLME